TAVHHAVAVPSMEERLAWKKLLFFGSIRRNKGLHLLLQAAEALPGYSITIAGEPTDGDYFRNEIVPQIRQLRERGMKIDLRDHFIPNAELAELFASHSAIVLPYTSEFVAQSGVVFMALAYEIPVVASEAGGLKDLLKKFKIGVNCSAATADGLAAGVNALFALDMRSQLEREIQAARRHYSWQKAAAATIDGYLAATPAVEENACTLETTAA
ncbi:MAG TPA: glycosyltransferase, partial [Tepidisphaeraceae bacterium]